MRAAVVAVIAGFALLGRCAPLHAQTVVDPTLVAFTASPDHNARTAAGDQMVVRYDMEVFEQGGSQPIVTLNLGKPVPAPDGLITVNFVSLLDATPAPGRLLQARVATVGPGGASVSELSNVFMFTGSARPGGASDVSVFLRAPASGVTFGAPAQIPLYAVFGASGSSVPRPTAPRGGTVAPPIANVRFYANGADVGVASSPPFQVLWQNVPAGTYEIVAVATTASGAHITSPVVTITVK